MTYGTEAVIPMETGFPTLRISTFTSDDNDELLKKSLDLIEERRENAMVQLAYHQCKLKQGYDSNVRLRPLVPRYGKTGEAGRVPIRTIEFASQTGHGSK